MIIAIGTSFLNSDGFKDYNDCVKHADSQSQRDQCTEDYKQGTD